MEFQFGVSIPFHGWVLEEDTFQTRAKNWLDHNNIGESNIFWPITWTGRPDPGMGNHAAFAAHLAPRADPPGLFESDRAGDRAHHRRSCLPSSRNAGLPAGHPAGIFAGGPRSEKHTELSAPIPAFPGVRSLRRMCITARDSPTAIRTRNIRATICRSTLRFDISLGKSFGEGDKYRLSLTASECGESPRITRQQPDLRRFPL